MFTKKDLTYKKQAYIDADNNHLAMEIAPRLLYLPEELIYDDFRLKIYSRAAFMLI